MGQDILAAHICPGSCFEIAFFLEKENNPPTKEPAREDLFKSCSIPVTPTTTPVLYPVNVESNSREEDLDARDLEMSKKVRRSYSRLETFGSASTSTPGRRSCFGFEGLLGSEDLARVSPVVYSKLTEVPRVKPWAPDTTLPGISPPVVKEKRKKRKVPEILSPRGSRRAYCKPMVKPEAQPVEKQKPEDPQVSEEPVLEPSSSEQKLDSQPEPTVTFLFTLLSTAEPTESKDPEKASDIQECQFLDKEDWGPRRTSREISHLQNDCRRLRESLSTIQADNRALREKLQNLLTVSYDSLKREAKAFLEEVKAAPEDARAFPEDAQAIPGMALSQVHWQHPHGTRGERTCLPQPVTQLPLPVATQLPEGGSVHPAACCSHDPQIPVSALAGPKAGD
ncbi:sororin isoform X2 [Canis lupus dingo]|uniref:sororin isoform X2 n=1 Tax=Canis lupus dingo TaxID=286419 RepID=UPI000DC746EE|nr:sororin isoform X2 [Canis lupus dingo]XP_038280975.1 sororin isoform X2 [Canis lupus familiaris]